MAIPAADRRDLVLKEFFDLLRSPADKVSYSHQFIKLDPREVRIRTEAVDQIIFLRAALQSGGYGLAMLPDLLVQRLPVASYGHGCHENVFGSHVRQRLPHVARDHLLVDDQSPGD